MKLGPTAMKLSQGWPSISPVREWSPRNTLFKKFDQITDPDPLKIKKIFLALLTEYTDSTFIAPNNLW